MRTSDKSPAGSGMPARVTVSKGLEISNSRGVKIPLDEMVELPSSEAGTVLEILWRSRVGVPMAGGFQSSWSAVKEALVTTIDGLLRSSAIDQPGYRGTDLDCSAADARSGSQISGSFFRLNSALVLLDIAFAIEPNLDKDLRDNDAAGV